MKIYLLGYFGSGAHADDLIGLITRRMFQSEWLKAHAFARTPVTPTLTIHDRTTHPCPSNGAAVAEFLSQYDLVVFCGGSLLGRLRLPPFHRIETWIHGLAPPLVLLGTGWRTEAQPLTPEEHRRMCLLLGRARAAYVRGELTRQQIISHEMPAERVRVLGDPGLCFGDGSFHIRGIDRIGVVARRMSDVEIAQDRQTLDNETWHTRLAQILDELVAGGYEVTFVPMTPLWREQDNDHKGEAAVRVRMVHRERVDSVAATDSTLAAHLGTFDFVLSQRLHGSLVSLAQGVPVFPIEYQFGKMADSLSLPGFEQLRDLITPQCGVTVETFYQKFPALTDPALLAATQAACATVRDNYGRVIGELIS